MIKPLIGQKLYYLDKAQLKCYGEVTRVGRVWFYVRHTKFSLENWKSDDGYRELHTLEDALRMNASSHLKSATRRVLDGVTLDNVKPILELISDIAALLEEGIKNDLKRFDK